MKNGSLKVLWTFKNIFETLHDLIDTSSKNSKQVKSYASFKFMQISEVSSAHIII